MRWVLILVVFFVVGCGDDWLYEPGDPVDRSRSVSAKESETADRDRVLALREKGGSFSVLKCTTFNLMTGKEEPCREERVAWERIKNADSVRWEDCAFGRHGLGGYLSEVTVVLDGDSWHIIYVYDKNVC